jgi:hypothetical protein
MGPGTDFDGVTRADRVDYAWAVLNYLNTLPGLGSLTFQGNDPQTWGPGAPACPSTAATVAINAAPATWSLLLIGSATVGLLFVPDLRRRRRTNLPS